MPRDALPTTADDREALPIAFDGPTELASELGAHGFRVIALSSDGDPSQGAHETPRLVLLAANDLAELAEEHAGEPSPLVVRVQRVRRRWPLVDALVSAPAASPRLVRDLLRAGACDVVLEDDVEVLIGAIHDVLDAQQLLPMVDRLAERRVRSSRFEGMLSRSHAMWDVFETCARVAPTDANVLICGETGTGKELLARALHRLSRRRGRFVAINCSSLPEHLVDSELFGHEKGAFTGAVRANKGIFRNAEGGTVFLDEIGDMPETAQQSLLRVLEERTVRPVGGVEEVPVDVRIVAATHVPLGEAAAEGRFREDLFYRLDVIRLQVPPLRERPEDIVFLFGHFAKSLAKHYGVERPEISDAFLARLAAYSWPGNVRELENFSERIVLRGRRSLAARDFTRLVRPAEEARGAEPASGRVEAPASSPRESPSREAPARLDLSKSLEDTVRPVASELERQYLEALLTRTRGRMQEAAEIAGISRRTLQRKLGEHGIDKARFRT